MAGIRREVKLFPVFRFATVIATAAFAVLVGADALFLRSAAEFPLTSQPARLVAEDAAELEVAVEEVVEGMLEAPLEDAVIGAAADDIAEADKEIAAPEALPLTTEGLQTPRESSFQEFGTETGAGYMGDETKVEPTGTVLAEGTREQLDGEQPVDEEPAVEAPALVEPVPLQEVEPTLAPNMLVEPRPSVDPLRLAEIGLGILALLSAAITFILRRAR
jgi:hypothetical protein